MLVADRNGEGAAAVAAEIGPSAAPFAVDVSRPEECEAMVTTAVAAFGALHVACNCAGIANAGGTAVADTSPRPGGGCSRSTSTASSTA